MIGHQFRTELAWFGTGLAVAGLTGLLLNAVSVTLLAFSVLYAIWTLKRLDRIVRWLQNGGKAQKAPFSHGLTEEMVRLVHREKKYSQKQKNRFKASLGQFNSLASSMPDAIIVINDDDEIRWSNPAARHMVNIHPERDRGQRIDNLIRNPLFSEFLQNESASIELEIQGAQSIDRMLELRRVRIKKNLTALIGADQKESPKHTFELELDDSLAMLGTEREIYSACNNLLTNAVKYTNAGTTITVHWGLDDNGDAVYSVTDNGPGIELRHLSRLSERFYRVDTGRSREQGGTGLGLAIVKHAVQRHGGSFQIQSQPGTGSTFSATFPGNRVHSLQQIVNQ